MPGFGLKNGNTVFLTSKATGQNLRVHPDGRVDGHGGEGKLAQWTVHRVDKDTVKFENKNNGNWLRIEKDGDLNGLGKGGPLTEFKLIKHKDDREISLRSAHHEGHVGVLPDGAPKNAHNTGTGPHGRFTVKVHA